MIAGPDPRHEFRPHAGHWRAVLLAAVLFVAACSAPDASPARPASAAADPAAASATSATRTPPSPSAALRVSERSHSTSAAESDDVPAPRLPPQAALTIGGGTPVPGELGTYVYDATGSDAPWLPARTLKPVTALAHAPIEVRLVDRSAISAWSARIAAAEDEQAERPTAVAAADALDPPVEAARFAGPGAGSWVLQVELVFASGRGSAVYYWHLEIR